MMLPRCWRLSEQRYRLQGVRCPVCQKVSLLGRPVCFERWATSINSLDKSECALPVAAEVDALQASACMLPGVVMKAEIRVRLGKP